MRGVSATGAMSRHALAAALALLALAPRAWAEAAPDPAALANVPAAQPGAPAFPQALRARLALALGARGESYVPRTQHRRPDGSPLYTNRLLLEPSPYLQQHAHNPVNWYPWGDEAFEAARRLGRPVLVSIGYSTCHWCHVMEEESFDDPETATLLNENFIAIKVDRETRPDVDAIYMSAIHALGQNGGWPLNVWVTPDRKPFYAGTYFPPSDRRGRPGFQRVLRSIHEQYSQDPERVASIASELSESVRKSLEGAVATSSQVAGAKAITNASLTYSSRADRTWGGMGQRTKFPSSFPIRLLLRFHRRTGEADILELAVLTLDKMAAGGIHDQLGGGFHRYSTEPRWLVPHFEKMLYDNALLAMAYLEASQVTGREDFQAVVRSTLDYVMREMSSVEGVFYSATDADSAGPAGEMEEGPFFTWTPAEIAAALDAEAAAAAIAWWGVTEKGNFEGRNILHAWRPAAEVAAELGITQAELAGRLRRARDGLYAARAKRPAPLRDEKILVAWNGLMISAFARAGFALDEPRYTEAARRAARFVLGSMRENGRLLRVSTAGQAAGPAFLEDYAFLIAALLDLYEADPDPSWLHEAIALQGVLDRHYLDASGGGYFKTANDHEGLLAREKPARDGAIPAGNSVAALNLLRLAEFTGDDRYLASATLLFSAFHQTLTGSPTSLAEMLIALDYYLDDPKEIVVVRAASEADGAPELMAPVRSTYLPNRIVSAVSEGAELAEHASVVPLLSGKTALAGRSTAYVCVNRACGYPTPDPAVLTKQLERVKPLEGSGKPSK